LKQTFVSYVRALPNAASGKTEQNRVKPTEGGQNPHNSQIQCVTAIL